MIFFLTPKLSLRRVAPQRYRPVGQTISAAISVSQQISNGATSHTWSPARRSTGTGPSRRGSPRWWPEALGDRPGRIQTGLHKLCMSHSHANGHHDPILRPNAKRLAAVKSIEGPQKSTVCKVSKQVRKHASVRFAGAFSLPFLSALRSKWDGTLPSVAHSGILLTAIDSMTRLWKLPGHC